MKKSILSILFWSIVSAAFIGPGTIAPTAKAGLFFSTNLLWSLLFSTLACYILQEEAARITMHSGTKLGESLSLKLKASQTGRFSLLSITIYSVTAGFTSAITPPLTAAITMKSIRGHSHSEKWNSKISFFNNFFLSLTLVISLIIGLKNIFIALNKIPKINIAKNSLFFLLVSLFSIIFTIAFLIFLMKKNG